jgi:alpha-beta hydrolase superfamily lysophospholipase
MNDEMAHIVSRTEDTTFITGSGVRLSARYFLPPESRRRDAGIVFCHGFGGVKEVTPPGLADRLAQYGYTVLTFDYRGFGASEGLRGHIVPAEQVEDAVTAIEFLARRDDVDPRRIGIYGNSFGGGIALLAARRNPRPRAAFVTVPVTSGDGWLRSIHRYHDYVALKERAFAAIGAKAAGKTIEMIDRFDLIPPDPHSRARHVTKQTFTLETFYHVSAHEPVVEAHALAIPVGIIGIRGDLLVPVEQATSLYERLPGPKRLHLFDTGNHHSVYSELLPDVADQVLPWFDQHLGG